MESETGATDFAVALKHAFDEENALEHYDARVASRTKVNSSTCEITFFKEKMNFMFDPDYFETMWSFLTEYCSKDLSTIK